jgi:bifunctional UDP-N-acetylglucosamine pyrophosphorylase/glucosamine-1-phosphate N-acetyltransferase
MSNKKITAVVLAAGKSKRTKTALPKVLLDLSGEPLIFHILESLQATPQVGRIVVVLGHKKELIQKKINQHFKGISCVRQDRLNGTAKAVQAAIKKGRMGQQLLVLCADTPLISSSTLTNFAQQFQSKKLDACLITAHFNEKNSYGRILRDEQGRIKDIIEKVVDKKPSEEPQEINSGIYCFEKKALEFALSKIKRNPRKKEYFLTDAIKILYQAQYRLGEFVIKDKQQILGVNTQINLARVRQVANRRRLQELMQQGVTIIDPRTTYVARGVKFGNNCIVYPFTIIEKNAIIGNNCKMGPFAHLQENYCLEDNSQLSHTIGNNIIVRDKSLDS